MSVHVDEAVHLPGGKDTVSLQEKDKGENCFLVVIWFICWDLLLFTSGMAAIFNKGLGVREEGVGQRKHVPEPK